MNTVLTPMLIQVGLTFAILIFIPLHRVPESLKDKAVARRGSLDPTAYSKKSIQIANNYNNQFQLPVLFYLGCIFAILSQATGAAVLVSAWAFVGLRIVHTIIHTTSNHLTFRFFAFLAGAIALAVFLILVFCHVLQSPLMDVV